jgi:hypothetical protein
MVVKRVLLIGVLVLAAGGAMGGELVANGGFEQGLEGWSEAWSRTPAIRAEVDKSVQHGGAGSVRIEHTGSEDWALGQQKRLAVEPGQIYDFRAWVRLRGKGRATLCVVLRDARGEVINWIYAPDSTRATKGWRRLRSRFVVPPGAARMWPRLIGRGPATVWLDDVSLRLEGTMYDLRPTGLPELLSAANAALEVTLRTADGSLVVRDRRAKTTWTQRGKGNACAVLEAAAVEGGFDVTLLHAGSMLKVDAAVRLDGDRPELTVELSADGELSTALAWPPPFATGEGTFLVMPVNEGISYPVDDASLRPMHYHLYGGHGLCMPWYGATDGERGWMAVVETADDAAVNMPRRDGLLCLAPQWRAQKGEFGYPRRLRYVFLDEGGYVAMAKRYRQHAKAAGLFKSLAEKRKAIPAVDRLVGAANVWCWEKDAPAWCRRLRELGIERVLWSNRRPPDQLRAMNEMGVLTSRYDIYQDTMNPTFHDRLRWVHGDWTTKAWERGDVMMDADGEWVRGWRVKAKDGEMIPCGVLCDRQAPDYARRRIAEELKTRPYRCRFIDTTTASPWRECYHPDHPMTRTESKRFKMQLLSVVSEEFGLVCGSETGHDAAVPYVHYFEGMLSLGPYRVPDAGRRMIEPWTEVPERVAKFQTGHRYRLPLWELVYHDCVVAQWYWGDYNNKLPSLWDRRDLWNALYGTPPMFMFNRQIWERHRDRFVQSYKTATSVARATGYSEMLSHRWLTDDHAVQRTRFANGVTVTVNFGETPHALPDGTTLEPMSHRVTGLEEAK